jgi:hypothetical protein
VISPLLWTAAAGIAIAFVLRWTLPSTTGVTIYLPGRTQYIPAKVLGSWCALVITLAIALIQAFRKEP